MDRDELAKFIVEKAKDEWNREGKPLHLAKIDPLLKINDVDYKSIIAPQKLIHFVEGLSEVFVVRHKKHSATIFVVPKGEEFSLEESEELEIAKEAPVQKPNYRSLPGKYVVLNFLDAVSRLDKNEAESIIIPVSVLAALMRIK